MDNEIKTIHDFDFELICEYFLQLDRQGPGSPEVTLKALSFIDNLTDRSKVADIGCGSGGQTMILAQNIPCEITGIDLYPGFIEKFNKNAESKNLQDRVKGIVGDMKNLPFREEELDLIWSEGAIDNIGFERGFNEWRKYLKQGGYLAVSESTWFTEERPDEIQDFWQEAYPEIDTISKKVDQMQKAGYLPVAAYVLPESIWTDFYYVQQPPAQEAFLKKYPGNKTVEEYIASERYERELYRKYKAYYGYVFYIGQKR